MAVPYIFSNVPGGSSIPLAQLDANFAYLTGGTPVFANLTLTGNLAVGGATTFTGPVTANDLAVNGSLTIDGTTINPTGITGTGLLVFNTNPTLVTPILGTPASGNLANCTNLPIAQVSGLATGILPFLTNPTTANLAAAVVDETGTGNLVLSNNPTLTSPTFIAPILGTPASGNLSLCTGYPAPSLSGVTQIANGGTGMSTTGTVGQILGVTAANTLGYISAPPASGIAGGFASQVLYQSAPNTTDFIANGTAGLPLVSNGAAVPSWSQINAGTALTGVLAVANGGTGAGNQQGAINNLAGSVATANYLRGNGANVVMSPIVASDVPILNQNTTGSAATFTSTSQNSQFNSIGINTAASAVSGQLNLTGRVVTGVGIQFASGSLQTDTATGYGQAWQNVTGARAAGTTYTNTTTQPIMVVVSLATGNGSALFDVGGTTVWGANTVVLSFANVSDALSVIVPPGATYILTYVSGAFTINQWAELR
jgi:hypothetical protein